MLDKICAKKLLLLLPLVFHLRRSTGERRLQFHEARFFYRAIKRSRMTLAEVRELITVPPSIDAALRNYVLANRRDGHITMVIDYRAHLWAEVERLLSRGRKRCATQRSSARITAT
jgi:hypothetical protein